MHRNRGGNGLPRWVIAVATYLTCLWLAGQAGFALAQPTSSQPDTLDYRPRTRFYQHDADQSGVTYYTSWTDLAAKLTQLPGKPYRLLLRLDRNPPADWQQLRTLPPAVALSVEVEDSVVNAALLPILATWPALEHVEISIWQSYTVTKNAKGEEIVEKSHERPLRVPATGWANLRAVKSVTLSGDINLTQALTAIQPLPALIHLSIVSPFENSQPGAVFPPIALPRLRTLTLMGRVISRNYVTLLTGLTGLRELTVSQPNVTDLNAGLARLPQLQTLTITHADTSVSQLRLGGLPALENLNIATGMRLTAGCSLDSALAGVTTLKRLNVDRIKLTRFPRNLLKNKQLTYLALARTGLTALPDSLDQLVHLDELIVDDNPLHRLPNGLCRLPRLRTLSASHCDLDALPAAFGQLTYLTELALNGNQLTQFPASVGGLRSLRMINVSMNGLTYLPDELARLPRLETIAAFGNQISRLPAGSASLRNLYLSDNQLKSLPDKLGTFPRLRTLLLDSNPLTHLPDSIGDLDSLETLVLGQNQLTTLPDALTRLPRLSRLVLNDNQVRALPEAIGGLASLAELTLANNPIRALPASVGRWRRLKAVQIDLPYLDALPVEIGQWAALESLTIEGDRLLVLPGELTNCASLSLLSATGNRLLGIPEAIGKLTRLVSLTVQGRPDSLTEEGRGQLLALPASLVNCRALTELRVAHQQRFEGVETVQMTAQMPGLRSLSLINCGLTDVDNVAWQNLPMRQLNLSKNRIGQLPGGVTAMPNLEQINLSETNLPAPLNRFFASKQLLQETIGY